MNYLTIEKINGLSTKRLLTYYKKYGHNWIAKFYCDSCGDFLCEYDKNYETLKKEYNFLNKK